MKEPTKIFSNPPSLSSTYKYLWNMPIWNSLDLDMPINDNFGKFKAPITLTVSIKPAFIGRIGILVSDIIMMSVLRKHMI